MRLDITIGDLGLRKPNAKIKRGSKIDIRWKKGVPLEVRSQILIELENLIRKLGLTMSGYGSDSYSGILSSGFSTTTLKRKLLKINDWAHSKKDLLQLFNVGKIQLVSDIFYE